MKKILRMAAVVLAVLLVFIVSLSLWVKSYLTEERMRQFVSEAAEKSVNRKVVVGRMDVSLWKGIVLRDFEIREKDSDAVFLKVKQFHLKYQLLPLLKKKLVIDELGLRDMDIYLRVDSQGMNNFSDILKKDLSEKKKEETSATSGLPIDLNVENIEIKNARISYVDAVGKLKKAEVVLHTAMQIKSSSREALSSEGSLQATFCELSLGDKLLKNIEAAIQYKIDVDIRTKQITLHRIGLDCMKIPVDIAGHVSYDSGMAYSLVIKVPSYNLSQLKPDVAASFLPEGMVLGGRVSASLNLNKKAEAKSAPRFEGSINLSRFSCTYKKMNLVLDGTVRLTPDLISLNGLKLIAGKNEADLSGTLSNYKEYPDVKVKITSRYIALDDLLNRDSIPGSSGKIRKIEEIKKEPNPLHLKLHLDASLDIEKTVYKGMIIHPLTSRCILQNNILSVPYWKGNTLGGTFLMKGSVNLAQKGTAYNIAADLQGIGLEEIVNAFVPKAKGKLLGTLSGAVALSGAGILPENIKRNLKGRGEFAVKNGTIKDAALSNGLLAILGLQELKEIRMDRADCNFTVADGIVNLKTVMNNQDMSIDETGTIGLDEKLDLTILVKVSDRLAPKLVRQSSLAQFLSSEKDGQVCL